MNRKPGPYDSWWKQHQANCGGYFVKVKGPTEEEVKEERKVRAKKKRAEERREKDREEKREEEKEDARRGVRQTDLRDSITATKKKRKRATKKDDEKSEGEQQTDNDGLWETGGGEEKKDAPRGSGQAKGQTKQRKKWKKLFGTGHVLGTGKEVKGRAKRRKKGGAETPHDDDSGAKTGALVDDAPSMSQPSTPSTSPPSVPSPARPAPGTVSSVSSSPPTSSTASTPSSTVSQPSGAPSSSAVSSSSPVRGLAVKSSAANVAPAARRRTTNIFDLMAARGEGGKVDQLVNRAKQVT